MEIRLNNVGLGVTNSCGKGWYKVVSVKQIAWYSSKAMYCIINDKYVKQYVLNLHIKEMRSF